MKLAIVFLIVIVTGLLLKGLYDMSIAVQDGHYPSSVAMGASPMILLGLFSLMILAKVLNQIGPNEAPNNATDPDANNLRGDNKS